MMVMIAASFYYTILNDIWNKTEPSWSEDAPKNYGDKTLSAKQALCVMEIQLEFMYWRYYTKMQILQDPFGRVLRLLSFFLVVATLIVFDLVEKKPHASSYKWVKTDIILNYMLFTGVVLEFVLLINLLLTEQIVTTELYKKHPHSIMSYVTMPVLRMKRQRWSSCNNELSTPWMFWK